MRTPRASYLLRYRHLGGAILRGFSPQRVAGLLRSVNLRSTYYWLLAGSCRSGTEGAGAANEPPRPRATKSKESGTKTKARSEASAAPAISSPEKASKTGCGLQVREGFDQIAFAGPEVAIHSAH